jgi:diguanylate cyclase (GGDEF)-like protein
MGQSHQIMPEVKEHLHDITNLYYFTRKLMPGFDIQEIMRVILEETNERLGSSFALIGVNFLDFNEVFAMPRYGSCDAETVRDVMVRHWDRWYAMPSLDRMKNGEIPIEAFGGRSDTYGGGPVTFNGHLTSLPMSVLGQTIGFIAVIFPDGEPPDPEREQFMYVFASMISSIVEHGYRDMQAKLQAKTDSLTGIANHRMFHETLEREIARADRSSRSFCLALIDIDNFKKINDKWGHQVGDAVLIDLTKRVGLQNRRGDMLARYGGEEFALLLTDTPLDGGRILAERVCAAIAGRPFTLAQTSIPYTISMGLSEYQGCNPRPKDILIGDADAALYESKQNGKNRVSIR